MTTVRPILSESEWNEHILEQGGHPLQLWGWGEVKAAHNWSVERVLVEDETKNPIGAAQLLIRRLPWPFRALVYIPRGPVCRLENREDVLTALSAYCRSTYKAVAVTIEPDWTEAGGLDGWKQSDNTILIPRTLILDLTQSEDELLSAMAKKTRQYIRKSAAEDIEIRRVTTKDELEKCLIIYRQTAARAGFALHGDQYYYDIQRLLGEHSLITAAYKDNEPVAFLWLALSQHTSFELYGGMNELGQQLRANYALKWHTIQLTRRWGIERYDFNGLLNDGVSTFKQGFARHETQLLGTFDKSLSIFYPLWDRGLPLVKKVLRKLKNR